MRDGSASLEGLVEDLIRVDSANPPGAEAAVADIVGARLSASGWTVERIEPEPGRMNLVVRWPGAEGPHVAFVASLDTVAADRAAWCSDPWSPCVADGRLVGLGAADMKGAVACLVDAAEALARTDPERCGASALLFLADTERGGRHGAAVVVDRLTTLPALAIVGGPTDGARCAEERGVAWFDVRIHRDAAAAGPSAVTAAARLIAAAERAEVGGLVVRATSVDALGVRNRPPDTAVVSFDARRPSGMSAATGRGRFAEIVASADLVGARTEVAVVDDLPGSSTRLGSGARAWLEGAADAVDLGRDRVMAMPGPTDARHLRAAGIPTVIVGPGRTAEAHRPDESVALDRLRSCRRLYGSLMRTAADAVAASPAGRAWHDGSVRS